MAGRFEGLTDMQWEVLEPLFADNRRVFGRPRVSKRLVLNSIFYILITGSRWCDLPQGPQWASRATAHRWLGVWSEDGTLQRAINGMLAIGELNQMVDWSAASVDGSFSPR